MRILELYRLPFQKGEALAENEIRLRYTGFIIFTAQILSVATGLVFQLMIARATTKPEYGIWFNINDVSTYFTLLVGVLPFWTLRFAARGREGAAKTGVLANLMMSITVTVIYLILLTPITSTLGIGEEYLPLYFLTALQMMELYSIHALEAGLRANKSENTACDRLRTTHSRMLQNRVGLRHYNCLSATPLRSQAQPHHSICPSNTLLREAFNGRLHASG
jgi:hypothetical protein